MPGYDSDTEEDSDNSDDEGLEEEESRLKVKKKPKKRRIPVTFRGSDRALGQQIADRVKQHLLQAEKEAGEYDWDEVSQTINTTIHYGRNDWTKQEEKDFVIASNAFRKGDVETIAKLKTKFCIAHYRGVTYGRNNFHRKSRRSHREEREVGENGEGVRAVYSMSVLKSCDVGVGDYNSGVYDGEKLVLDELDNCARLLKKVLLAKRDRSTSLRYGSITFDTQADLLQHIYTNNYKHTFSSIKAALGSKQGLLVSKPKVDLSRIKPKYEEEDDQEKRVEKFQLSRNLKGGFYLESKLGLKNIPSDWKAYEGLFNDGNPFVSTGDTPRHALKYAYGMKFYGDLKGNRLFPSWDYETGRVKRPYSGKAYVMLHGLLDYLADAPLHVPTLNTTGRIRVGDEIVEERETTFPAYIPRERVVFEHIAKFPSFDGYRIEHHLEKYGLDEEDYEHYRDALYKSSLSVLSKNENYVQESRNIEAWLVNFHEARLIEIARRMAKKRGMLLVYKSSDGGLCKQLTSVRRDKDVDERLYSRELESKLTGKHDYSFSFSKEVQALAEQLSKKSKVRSLEDEYGLMSELRRSYRLQPVLGDGNCLFRAIAVALRHARIIDVQHTDVRTAVCDLFTDNPEFRAACNLNTTYVANMSFPAASAMDFSRWGGDNEMAAAAVHYKVKIVLVMHHKPTQWRAYKIGTEAYVVINPEKRTMQFGPLPAVDRQIVLLHENGNHFTALLPLGG